MRLTYLPPLRQLNLRSPVPELFQTGPLPRAHEINDDGWEITSFANVACSAMAATVDCLNHNRIANNREPFTNDEVIFLRDWLNGKIEAKEEAWPWSFAAIRTAIYDESDDHATVVRDYLTGQPSRVRSGACECPTDPLSLDIQAIAQSRYIFKLALAAGYPIAIGFGVERAWFDLAVGVSGQIQLPRVAEPIIGGTCVVLTGWDDDKQEFSFRNLLGRGWGFYGKGRMPMDYACKSYFCQEAVIIWGTELPLEVMNGKAGTEVTG